MTARYGGQAPTNRGATVVCAPIPLVREVLSRISRTPARSALQQTAPRGRLSREGASPTVTSAAHLANQLQRRKGCEEYG